MVDTKFKDIVSVTLVDGDRTQLFAIGGDYNIWTMYMTNVIPTSWWTQWEKFPMPGKSGGVIKIIGKPGKTFSKPGPGTIMWYPRLWAIDLDNELWSCNGMFVSGGKPPWGDWVLWKSPYPND
jgi:hypothetical protein